jgi:hypothetical protein
MSCFWPDVSSVEGCKTAAHVGAVASFFIAGVTAGVPSTGAVGSGLNASFPDAAIFAFAGWRIWKLSRAWAVISLVLHILGLAFQSPISSTAEAIGAILMTIVLALALVSGIRGTFAYDRLSRNAKKRAQREQQSSVIC